MLLGPYTGEEHGRRGVVVRDARLNRAYGASVRLAERTDPDEGKKKHGRAADVDVRGPIVVVPLRAAGPYEMGGSSRGQGDASGPAAKRAAVEPSEEVERAESNSVSSGARAVLANGRAGQAVEVGGRVAAEAASVAGLFGLARLPLQVSSSSSASLAIYGRDTWDTEVVPVTPQLPTGMIVVLSPAFSLVLACVFNACLWRRCQQPGRWPRRWWFGVGLLRGGDLPGCPSRRCFGERGSVVPCGLQGPPGCH